jgi:hypothetical protein
LTARLEVNMDKTTAFIIVSALWWLSGVFFGMGIEEKLFEPMRRKRQAKKSEGCSPEPLPMQQIETPDDTKNFSEEGLLIMPKRNENDRAVGVVLGRRNVLPSIPVCDSGDNTHSQTSNVELRGCALLRSPA